MTNLPLIRDVEPGIYQVCTDANTDYPITVPEGALGLVIWFETSAADATLVGGRIGIDQANTEVTGLTGTDTDLGYHPPMPMEYTFQEPRRDSMSEPFTMRDSYIHVASATAGAVVRGMWLYAYDTGA